MTADASKSQFVESTSTMTSIVAMCVAGGQAPVHLSGSGLSSKHFAEEG
jgi:hypothetical protein